MAVECVDARAFVGTNATDQVGNEKPVWPSSLPISHPEPAVAFGEFILDGTPPIQSNALFLSTESQLPATSPAVHLHYRG